GVFFAPPGGRNGRFPAIKVTDDRDGLGIRGPDHKTCPLLTVQLRQTGPELVVCAKEIALAKEIDVLIGKRLHELVLDFGWVASHKQLRLLYRAVAKSPMFELIGESAHGEGRRWHAKRQPRHFNELRATSAARDVGKGAPLQELLFSE